MAEGRDRLRAKPAVAAHRPLSRQQPAVRPALHRSLAHAEQPRRLFTRQSLSTDRVSHEGTPQTLSKDSFSVNKNRTIRSQELYYDHSKNETQLDSLE
jgi:hypothetical protein